MRFHLKDLFLAITLIGIGFGGSAIVFQYDRLMYYGVGPPLFVVSGGAIGGGCGAFFHQLQSGAIIGGLLFLALLFTLILLPATLSPW